MSSSRTSLRPNVNAGMSANGTRALQAAGVMVLAATLALASLWPVAGPWLAAGLLLYAVVLLFYPLAWLWLLPSAVAVLDLTPWTGWLYFGEVELALLVTGAVALLAWPVGASGAGRRLGLPRLVRWAWAGLVISTVSGVVIAAVWWLQADAFAWGDYASPWNTLRAAWGVGAACLLLWLARVTPVAPQAQLQRGLMPGMALGCLTAVIAVLRERAIYPGLWDLDSGFRVAGWFTDMHVGGPSLAAFLALTIPFALVWAWQRRRCVWLWTVAVSLLTSYTTVVTFTRSAWLAVAVALVALLVFARPVLGRMAARAPREAWLLAVTPVVIAITMAGAMLDGFAGERWAATGGDAEGRWARWASIVALHAEASHAPWVGHGVGTFPAVYRLAQGPGEQPGNYSLVEAGQGAALWLGPDRDGRLAQRLPGGEVPSTAAITLRVRGPEGARLRVAVCQESVVYPVRCQARWLLLGWPGFPDGNAWQRWTVNLPLDGLGGSAVPGLRPAHVLSLDREDLLPAPLLIDRVRLVAVAPDHRGAADRRLLRNADFQQDSRYWYYTTRNYDAWRTENQLLEIYFDQGVIGATLWLGLLLAALGVVWRSGGWGSLEVVAAGAAILGSLAVGAFATIFFNPHIALLFYGVLLLGVASLEARAPAQGGPPVQEIQAGSGS